MPGDGPPRVTLLGFTVPDEVLDEVMSTDVLLATQTHSFAWGLVASLRAAGCRVTLLSAAPASTYPRNRRILFRSGCFSQGDVDGRLLGFVNLLGLKHITRFAAAWRSCLRAVRAPGTDVLLVHGVHTPFLLCGALLARRGVPMVPVMTDPPGVVQPGDNRVVRLLRRIDVALVRAALRRCAGVVALTRPLAEEYAPGRPRLILDGICDPPRPVIRAAGARASRDIVYAGGLSRAYGVDRLVTAFRGLPDADLRLLLYGRGELDAWLREQAGADPRIRAPELLSRDELAGRLSAAALLVNPRPVDQEFVRYSFPSKIIEYLSSGAPVLTTRLPGIGADYESRLVFAETDTVEGLREAIRTTLALSPAAARELGSRGAAFVRRTRGTLTQGRRLRAFLAGFPPSRGVAEPWKG